MPGLVSFSSWSTSGRYPKPQGRLFPEPRPVQPIPSLRRLTLRRRTPCAGDPCALAPSPPAMGPLYFFLPAGLGPSPGAHCRGDQACLWSAEERVVGPLEGSLGAPAVDGGRRPPCQLWPHEVFHFGTCSYSKSSQPETPPAYKQPQSKLKCSSVILQRLLTDGGGLLYPIHVFFKGGFQNICNVTNLETIATQNTHTRFLNWSSEYHSHCRCSRLFFPIVC